MCSAGMLDRYAALINSDVMIFVKKMFFFLTDPTIVSPQKAIEMIGASLQKQYERWQPRARYKSSLDPTVEDVKKLCSSLRRNAKEERVLFHYNGHGVPRPTVNGEIWVFNRVRPSCSFLQWRFVNRIRFAFLFFRRTHSTSHCRFTIYKHGWVHHRFTFTIARMLE